MNDSYSRNAVERLRGLQPKYRQAAELVKSLVPILTELAQLERELVQEGAAIEAAYRTRWTTGPDAKRVRADLLIRNDQDALRFVEEWQRLRVAAGLNAEHVTIGMPVPNTNGERLAAIVARCIRAGVITPDGVAVGQALMRIDFRSDGIC